MYVAFLKRRFWKQNPSHGLRTALVNANQLINPQPKSNSFFLFFFFFFFFPCVLESDGRVSDFLEALSVDNGVRGCGAVRHHGEASNSRIRRVWAPQALATSDSGRAR
jgi:hypothetical protein